MESSIAKKAINRMAELAESMRRGEIDDLMLPALLGTQHLSPDDIHDEMSLEEFRDILIIIGSEVVMDRMIELATQKK